MILTSFDVNLSRNFLAWYSKKRTVQRSSTTLRNNSKKKSGDKLHLRIFLMSI